MMNRPLAAASVKGTVTFKYRYIFLFTTIFAIGSVIFIYNKGFIDIEVQSPLEYYKTREEGIINTEGCTIPALKTLDDSVKPFVKYPYTMLTCKNSSIALLGRNATNIWVRHDASKYYNVSEADEISCCYQGFYRPASIEDIDSPNIDNRVKYEACRNFTNIIDVKDEFVRVTCLDETKVIYMQYFLFAPKKKFIKHGNVDEIVNKNGYNILVLGMDSVSRLNLHRTMPRMIDYLNEKGAIEFLGYNKVADNTFPNLIPMLLGKTVPELKETCYPHGNATFDNCPFVWEWFKQAGYYTALLEDATDVATFNLCRRGFSNTPTDYYLRTFFHEAEQHVGIKNFDIFKAYICMNDIYFYKVILDYVQDITWSLKSRRLFGFFWEVSMSHDFVNYPMVMDDDYVTLLQTLEATRYLDDTILFLVSDHGMRRGEIRLTRQGRFEDRLPYLYVLTPVSFQKKYATAYKNLKLNSGRLTTPFDLHATLLDLVDLKNLENDVIEKRSEGSYANGRRISLFLPVPGNRTCRIADIDDHWCTCHEEVPQPTGHPQVIEAANAMVTSLNSMFVDYPQCAMLSLDEILDATMIKDNSDPRTKLMVMVRTIPGGGIFEATLRLEEDQKFHLTCNPSRLNIYAHQSHCINHENIKMYCYCHQNY